GVPLLEIVSEPDLRTAENAGSYLRALRSMLQYLEICDGNMEEGSFRCDANVSVRPEGTAALGTKTELKNLNSFRAVEKAIRYEIQRHADILSDGGQLIQETRLWDSDHEVTRAMRTKEFAHDYRYFPDPDLLPLIIDENWIREIRNTLPELPDARRSRFIAQYGLPAYDVGLLTSRKDIADFFEQAVAIHPNPKAISNWILGDLFRVVKEYRLDEQLYITSWPTQAQHLAELVRLIDEGIISGKIAKSVFDQVIDSGRAPSEIVAEKGLEQLSDASTLEAAVQHVMAANTQQVSQYLAGNEKVFGFLVGQVMKATQGKANPQKVNELLKKKLHAGV
ncbi:MAG: Asp-tRNA(Asn)/Glu-tRNA(Gln) amidotransferase subunit GatB, partial [Alphaproteobacteria bacterium]